MTTNSTPVMGADIFNNTELFNTSTSVLNYTKNLRPLRLSKPVIIVINVAYVVGIICNLAAIVYLRTGKRRVRNKKHLLLLTAMTSNDLAALVLSMSAMLAGEYIPGAWNSQWLCAVRVVLRLFGFGSGCIASTMALERYLAITRPFFYRTNVTYRAVCWALLISWLVPATLTCLSIFGLSAYYSEAKGCLRLYKAESTPELAYALTNMVLGTLLCVMLVYFNTAVIRELCSISLGKTGRNHKLNNITNLQAHQADTPAEVTFSWSIATLSVVFLITWLPLLLSAALLMVLGPAYWHRLTPLRVGSDVLFLLHYVLNPILYVHIWHRRPLTSLCLSAANCFKA